MAKCERDGNKYSVPYYQARWTDIPRQMRLVKIRENKSLLLYGELKNFWGRKVYTSCYTRQDTGIARCRLGI
jgi:hypothetical protein